MRVLVVLRLGIVLLTVCTCIYGEMFAEDGVVNTRIYPSTAYHVEEDVGNPEQLIYASYQSLNTLKKGGERKRFVGSEMAYYREGRGDYARFKYISSFYQVNSTLLLVVDKMNHCLRLVDRSTSITKQFAGKCTIPGFENGESANARFSAPTSVIPGVYVREYYLSDSDNNAIRLIKVSPDYRTAEISTIIQDGTLTKPNQLAIDNKNNQLLVSMDSRIARVGLDSQVVENVVTSSVMGKIGALVFLSEDIVLIGDKTNKRLLKWNASVSTDPKMESIAFSTSIKPYSLFLSKNGRMLYIGSNNYIKFAELRVPLGERITIPQLHVVPTTVTSYEPETTTSVDVRATAKGLIADTDQSKESIKGLIFQNETTYIFLALTAVILLLAVTTIIATCRRRRRRRETIIECFSDGNSKLVGDGQQLTRQVLSAPLDDLSGDTYVGIEASSAGGYEIPRNVPDRPIRSHYDIAYDTQPGIMPPEIRRPTGGVRGICIPTDPTYNIYDNNTTPTQPLMMRANPLYNNRVSEQEPPSASESVM